MAYNHLARALRLRYTEEIREKSGGTYGVRVSNTLSILPTERFNLSIFFDTDPELMEELVEVVHDEIRKIAENGVLAEDFQKTQEAIRLQFEQQQRENGYWSSVLFNFYHNERDTHTHWQRAFDSVDAVAVQNFAQEILKQGNTIEVVMLPE
jgi:zinc protease